MPRDEACVRCPLHLGVRTVCVWGVGPKQADIMLVGEAPGATEDSTGIPFVGRAGQLLDRCLDAAFLSRDQVYITNSVKCRPPGNRDPEPAEQKACWQFLEEEIKQVKPKVIVAMGALALFQLTGKKGITGARGKLLKPKKGIDLGEAQLMATLHPAYALRQGEQAEIQITEDLLIAARMVGKAPSPELPDLKRIILNPIPNEFTAEDVEAALETLANSEWLACDLEWNSVLSNNKITWPWHPGGEILTISFAGWSDANTIQTVSIAWFEWLVPILKQFMKDHILIFHNGISDGIWLKSVGLPFAPGGDTMAIIFVLDEEAPRSLEVLTTTIAKLLPSYKHTEALVARRPTERAVWEKLCVRNGDDVYGTLIVHDLEITMLKNLPEPERTNLIRLYTRMILPSMPIVCGMSLTGAFMDVNKMDENISIQEAKLEEVVQKITTQFNERRAARQREIDGWEE